MRHRTTRQCRAAAPAALLGLALLASGCSGGEPEPERSLDLGEAEETLPDDATQDAPDTAGTDGDSAATSGIATSYPEVGLEFTTLPEVRGPARSALRVYVDYERGLRETGRTGEVADLARDNATGRALSFVEGGAEFSQREDTVYAGEVRIDVSVDQVERPVALLSLCLDGSDLELQTDAGTEPVTGPSVVPVDVTLNQEGGQWTVTGYTPREGTC